MTDASFHFHHPLCLNRITENLTSRLAGVSRETKIENDDSSESIDEVNDEFYKNMDFKYDPKYIRKKYTFTKKKKPKAKKAEISNTLENLISLHKDRLNTDKYFQNVPKKKKTRSSYRIDYFEQETKPIHKKYLSNYDMRESDGYQNIYPFLTEFDYEDPNEKLKREHLESLHLDGKKLVPMSCNKAKLSAKTNSVIENSNDHKIMLYVNQTLKPWGKVVVENTDSKAKSLFNSPHSTDIIDEEKPLDAETKFRMTIEKPMAKFVPYTQNTRDRVIKRTEIKRKTTSAINAIHAASHIAPSVNSNWPSAKQSVVVKRKEKTMNDYLENRMERRVASRMEIRQMGRELHSIEETKRKALENQKIPDWARAGVGRSLIITAPKKTKVKVQSKYMNVNDYLL